MARYPLKQAARTLPALGIVVLGLASCTDDTPSRPRVVQSLLEQRHDKVIVQQWDVSCGAAALASLLTYDLSHPVSEKEVAAEMLHFTSVERVQSQLGFSLLDLKRYSESHDFVADGYGNMTLRDLIEAGPSIVPVVLRGFNHFMVFRGVQGDRVLLADPAWGNRTVQMPEFIDMWRSRVAFTVTRKGDKLPLHRMAARSGDFLASSDVFASAEDKIVVAQLMDKGPDVSQQFASAEPKEPLSVVAAGPASGIARGGQPEPIGDVARGAPNPTAPKEMGVAARPQPSVRVDRGGDAPPPGIMLARADARMIEPLANSAIAPPRTAEVPPRPAVEDLLHHADVFVDQGDIVRARIYFELAANLGSAKGAMGAGRTYDPQFLAKTDAAGIAADLTTAARWYAAALDMMRRSVDAQFVAHPHS